MKNRNKRNLLWWTALVAGLLLVNFLASQFHVRWDLTEDRRYSLTPTTRALLRDLEGPLEVNIFLEGALPADFRKLRNTTEDFFRLLRETNSRQVSYRFIDPAEEVVPGRTWRDSLLSGGLQPINLQAQVAAGQEIREAFPFALLTYNGQALPVSLYEGSSRLITPAALNNAEAMMEYQFAKSVDKLVRPQAPNVAYADGHGEPTGPETYDLVNTVQGRYNFGLFNLKAQPSIPAEVNVLLVVKPAQPFTDADKLKIDQFVMRGGRVLWFIDNLFAEPDSLTIKDQLIAYDRNLGLQDQLFTYGARINPDLLMDLQCDFLPFAVGGSGENTQFEYLRWNYYPVFESRNNHAVNKNLGLVAGRFVNSVDTVEAPGIRKTFLLQSSDNARTISTPALISPNENRNAPQDALFRRQGIPAAVLLEGSFPSFFRARLGRAQRDSLAAYGGFRQQGPEDGRMIVVADGDIVLNGFSTRTGPIPMGKNLFTLESQYELPTANRDFLLNCLEYLTGSSALIQTRNKEVVLRLLDMPQVARERTQWQLINIALPILLVLLAGWIYQQLRKRRYARG